MDQAAWEDVLASQESRELAENQAFLSSMRPFALWGRKDISQLASMAKRVEYEKGEKVFSAGHEPDALLIVMRYKTVEIRCLHAYIQPRRRRNTRGFKANLLRDTRRSKQQHNHHPHDDAGTDRATIVQTMRSGICSIEEAGTPASSTSSSSVSGSPASLEDDASFRSHRISRKAEDYTSRCRRSHE